MESGSSSDESNGFFGRAHAPAAHTIVSKRALIARLQRRLAHRCVLVRRARGGRQLAQVGEVYIIEIYTSAIVATHVNLEQLGRDFGALSQTEKVAS